MRNAVFASATGVIDVAFPNKTGNRCLRVAIGPLFYEFGGVSQHIHAITLHSKHRIFEIPSRTERWFLHENGRRVEKYKLHRTRKGLKSYDILHSHVDPWFTRLCMDNRSEASRWIHTYHTLLFEEDYKDGLNPLQNEVNHSLIQIASKADARICISNWLQSHLEEEHSISTVVIPNGVDVEKCKRGDRSKFVKNYEFDDFVLFVGSIDPIKAPDDYVKLAIEQPKEKFIMAGKQLTKENIETKYNIKCPRNLFFIGELDHESTLDAIAGCKALVMTSRREGIPTVLLEAMAMAKPVVAPNHYGCREVIHDDRYGFLYEPGSIDELNEKTLKAIESKGIGKNAQERVAEIYDWKVIAPQIDKLYESIS